jgi:hypothetical protein
VILYGQRGCASYSLLPLTPDARLITPPLTSHVVVRVSFPPILQPYLPPAPIVRKLESIKITVLKDSIAPFQTVTAVDVERASCTSFDDNTTHGNVRYLHLTTNTTHPRTSANHWKPRGDVSALLRTPEAAIWSPTPPPFCFAACRPERRAKNLTESLPFYHYRHARRLE